MGVINNYDRINVPKMEEGKENGYLCSMCGQYVSKKDSTSYRGYNLVCMHCVHKMQHLTDDFYVLQEIQDRGRIKYIATEGTSNDEII